MGLERGEDVGLMEMVLFEQGLVGRSLGLVPMAEIDLDTLVHYKIAREKLLVRYTSDHPGIDAVFEAKTAISEPANSPSNLLANYEDYSVPSEGYRVMDRPVSQTYLTKIRKVGTLKHPPATNVHQKSD